MCAIVCNGWRQKIQGVGENGALRLLRRLEFAQAPHLGIDDVVSALQRMGANLTHLDLSELAARKPLTWCLAEESSRRLLAALQAFQHPHSLHALSLPPSNPFYSVADWVISSCTSLTHLTMRFGHPLAERGFAALTDLSRLTRLRRLEVEGRFGNDECEALAHALVSMPFLCALDLKSECIGARGCRALGSSFPCLHALSHLSLRVADIGVQVCVCVCARARKHTRVSARRCGRPLTVNPCS